MSDNSAARLTVRQWVNDLRELARSGPEMLAAEVAGIAKAQGDKAIAGGQSLDGDKWPEKRPTFNEAGGGQAYVNGSKYFTTFHIGRVVMLEVAGPMVFAQFGTRKMQRRPVLPKAGIPSKLGSAIALGYVTMCDAWLTRKGRKKFGGASNIKGMVAK